MIDNRETGCHWIDRYCQFIIVVRIEPIAGLSMSLSDYRIDSDMALDEYLILQGKKWDKEDRDKIMKFYQEIQNNNPEIAELITVEPVS